ncbi:MAG: MgtC/SapB family protein [Desulfobacterales bacterium]|nr:MgtC/SapB family protein [Desulfobacterales bacterium]
MEVFIGLALGAETTETVLRLTMGALLGGIIGYERQVHGRSAGLRTQMLTCIASVLIILVSEHFYLLSVIDPSFIRIDPGRIAAGAITGIGFLGAGVIIKTGASIQGLTTAACLWMVSAIGIAVGTGLYIPAAVACGLTVISLNIGRIIGNKSTSILCRNLPVIAGQDFKDEQVLSVFGRHKAIIHDIFLTASRREISLIMK